MDQNVIQKDVNIYVLNKMPNDCTAPAFLVPTHVQSPFRVRGSHTHSTYLQAMAIAKMRKNAGQLVRRTNNQIKQVSREVNRLDKAVGGLLLNNVVGQSVVPVLNAGAQIVDYFDTLMGENGVVDHPNISSGLVAGVSQSMPVRRSAPRITGSKGTITITHKELVGEVASLANGTLSTSPTTTLGQSVLYVNPTNGNLFPWLSSIAGGYDYFKFKRLRLVYVPLCSTATAGRVMLGHDPDGQDPIPYDRSALSSYRCSADAPMWGVTKLDAVLPTHQSWYQTNTPASTAMFSTNTQGQVFWATWAGGAATVGEVYVLYEVTLKDPQPNQEVVHTATGSANTVTSNFPFGAPAFWVLDGATDIKMLFNATGTFRVDVYANTTSTSCAFSTGGSIALLASTSTGSGSAGANALVATAIVNVTGLGTYTIPGGATTNFAYLQTAALTGLAAWTVKITRTAAVTSFP